MKKIAMVLVVVVLALVGCGGSDEEEWNFIDAFLDAGVSETVYWSASCSTYCDGTAGFATADVCWRADDDPAVISQEGVDQCTAELSLYCAVASCDCTVEVTDYPCTD